MTISVVVCDDQGIIRSGIARILEGTADFQLVTEAPTGELLMQTLRSVNRIWWFLTSDCPTAMAST